MTYSASELPEIFMTAQKLVSEPIADIKATLLHEFARIGLADKIKPGQTVALTGGSRGIANMVEIMRETIGYLRSLGAEPFIIPAMGSHGGATAQGQVEVLAELGITEAAVGASIRATMEVREIGVTADRGIKVYIDRYAWEADHVVPINRIKPHTKYKGELESGLCKMINIGLGKYFGAQYYHHCALADGFPEVLESVSTVIIREKSVPFGLAIVEDGYDRTAVLEAIPGEEIVSREKELLDLSKRYIPRLPFKDIDFLVVDWMGKEISGAGMDSNVTGRNRDIMKRWYSDQKIKRLFVRDITPISRGNGVGLGLADFTTQRLIDHLDLKKTFINGMSTCYPEAIMLPPAVGTDREGLEACMNSIGLYEPGELRIVWIRDTAHLERVCLSRVLAEQARGRDDLELLGEPFRFPFDEEDNLVSPL